MSRALKILLLLGVLALAPAWFLGLLAGPNPKLGPALKPTGKIRHPEIDEASGLVQSATHPERFWLHNDSGDVPRIFAMTLDGTVIVPPTLAAQGVVARAPEAGERLYQGISISGATLHDWEDITRHGDQLYIADTGNNFSQRRHLGVYQVAEPDPDKDESAKVAAFYPIIYPDQTGFPPTDGWDFDCEAVFWWNDKLYFVTKTRPAFRVYVQGTTAGLYRLDSMSTNKDNTLTRIDGAKNLGGWVTAADVSSDGRYLAILIESPVQSVWIYERPAQGDKFFSQASSVRRFMFHDGGQIESLAFHHQPDGSNEIVLVNEERKVFRVSMSWFSKVEEEKPTPVQTSSR